MKRKLFLLLCALLTTVGMWADVVPIASIPSAGNNYYLYNPVTGKFLFRSSTSDADGYYPYVQLKGDAWTLESSDKDGYYKLRLKGNETAYFWGRYWSFIEGNYSKYPNENYFQIQKVENTDNDYKLHSFAWDGTANSYVYINAENGWRVAGNSQDQGSLNTRYTIWQFVTEADYATYISEKYGEDVSSKVTNTTFDSNISGWTAVPGFTNNQKNNNQYGAFTGYFWENWKSNTSGGGSANKMHQTISSIENGVYTLVMAAFVNYLDGEHQYVFANDDKTYLTTTTPTYYEVQTFVKNNSLSIGLEQTSTTAGWMGIDNVHLYYLGNDISYYSPKTFDGDDEATKDTWYAFTVESAGVYKITSTAAATIRYTQDDSDDADTGGKTTSLAASGYTVMKLSAGTFYFKSSANSTITISTTLANGDDVTTAFITNPSFETGNSNGWDLFNTGPYMRNRNDELSNKVGTYYFLIQSTNTYRHISQSAESLPQGKFILSVNARAQNDASNNTLNMGSCSTPIPVGLGADTYFVAFETAENNENATIKLDCSFGDGIKKVYCDNFTLTYYTTLPDVSITDLTSSAMSADVRAALDAANTAYTGSKTVANYNALQTAIVNAKVSIAEYAAKTGADADWTGIIRNPSFEPNDYRTGWTVTVSSGSSTGEGARSKDGGLGDGGGSKRFFIWTANAGAATVKQTLNELPSGNYKLSAYMASAAGDVFTLSAGSTFSKVIASDGNATLVEAYFTQASTGNIEISATHSGSWFDVDNFHLTSDPTLPESITGVSGNMNSTVASAQTTAVNAYNAESGQTFANMLAAQTAMNNARASILVYNDISNLVTTYAERVQNNLDAVGQAAYDASTVEGKITSGTYVTAAEAEADLKAAYIIAVKAQTTPGTDMTEAITNPSFESATGVSTTIAGWTNEANKTLQTQSNNGWAKVGNYYAERWHSTGEKHIHQTVTGLHAGAYVLTAKAYASNVTSAKVYVKVGETESAIDVAATNDYSVLFNYDGTSELKIGFFSNMSEDGSNNWICIDNFRLTYSGVSQPDLPLYTTEPMNATAKANANTAINNYNANKTSENYTAAESAIAVAEASKTAYNRASLEGYKSRMGELLAKTNVYTEAAYNKWYANVDDNYANGIYTDEEVVTLTAAGACQGATEDTHKKANRIDDVLLSTWTIGGEQCSDYDKSLYINTWSLEGNIDGSGFQTPFFEYWTSDGSLGAATMVGTVTGLEVSAEYSVDIWARVRQTNNQTKVANSITMQVGSGSSVDLTAGTQVGSSQFYIDHFTATGSTDESGNLTITIAVAANSYVSWLSFKDVAVSKQATTGDVQTYSGLINNDTELVPTTTAPIVDITEATFTGDISANFSSNANGFIIATAEQKAALDDVKNVVVDNTCDNLVLTDGVKAVIPAALTQATSATYSRTIAAASNYGTICLPYAVKSDDDIQYYTVNQIVGNVLKLNEVESVAAGTPAIFKKKNGGATNITAAASNVPVTDDAGVEASLVGTFERLAVGDEGSSSGTAANKYYYIKNNEFVRGLDYFYINPFRAYIDTNDSSETPARLVIGTDSETAINELKTLDEKQGLKDGKYLIGGKVIVVKAGKQFNVNGVLK